MRKLYLSILLVLWFNVTYAQWQWQNPKPVGFNLSGVHAFSPTEMIATTRQNVLIRTIDGGSNWIYEFPDAQKAFTRVKFNGTTGWAVGDNGAISKSTDKGDSWTDQSTSGGEAWQSIEPLSSSFAVAVGFNGKMGRTINGTNWTVTTITGNFLDVSFRSFGTTDGVGIAVGENGVVAQTTNGGQSWTPLPSFTTANLTAVFYQPGSLNVWAVGYGGNMWKSVDDGANWTALTNPLGAGVGIFNDIMIVGTRGYITGGGVILRSNNGGDTWNSYFTDPTSASLFAVSMVSVSECWVVGQGGKVLRNTDGVSFNTVSKGYGQFTSYYGIDFANLNNGVVCGSSGSVKYTIDGGNTWNVATSSATINQLNSVAFSDLVNVCAAGNGGTIIRSIDGGDNWTAQTQGTEDLKGIAFGNGAIGAVVGNGGVIFKTGNSGGVWALKPSGTTENLNAVSFADASKGLAVGDNGTVLFTANGGDTWQPKPSGTTEKLLCVHYIKNKAIAYAGGANGTVLKSINNGDSWTVVPNAAQNAAGGDVTGIQGTDENNVVFLSAGAYIPHTSDNGTTWSAESTTVIGAFSLYGLKAADGSNIWTTGERSSILRSQAGLTILPITLSSFTAQAQNKKVQLNWSTSMELNNTGFAIMRKPNSEKIWEQVGFVRSFGNSNTTQSYSFIDEPTGGETFLYQLKQIDIDDKSTLSNILKVKLEITDVAVASYPNPFKGQTTISYSITSPANVQLLIRNQLGQIVKTIVNAKHQPGNYAVTIHANELSAGTYYAELNTGNSKTITKMSLLK